MKTRIAASLSQRVCACLLRSAQRASLSIVTRRAVTPFAAAVGAMLALCVAAPNAVAQSNTWITKTSMPTARAGSVAAAIDGKLFALGGYDSATINNTYDV